MFSVWAWNEAPELRVDGFQNFTCPDQLLVASTELSGRKATPAVNAPLRPRQPLLAEFRLKIVEPHRPIAAGGRQELPVGLNATDLHSRVQPPNRGAPVLSWPSPDLDFSGLADGVARAPLE